jgi:hypothetical protein
VQQAVPQSGLGAHMMGFTVMSSAGAASNAYINLLATRSLYIWCARRSRALYYLFQGLDYSVIVY